jgi:hypothetical protein
MAKPSLAPLIGGALTAGLAAFLLPPLFGDGVPLLTRVAGCLAFVFFAYLFFRSARSWEHMLAEVRSKRG